MAKRRAQFPHRYTTVHISRDGKRVPFVRLSGRLLEAFGFKEGAKFAAVGVEGGLLVLTSENTKRREVAAHESFRLRGRRGSNPRPPA